MKRIMNDVGKTIEISESEEVKLYREKIIEMVEQIEDEKFLNQIHTILRKHIEKRGG